MDGKHILSGGYLLVLQLMVALLLFNIRGAFNPPECRAQSPGLAPEKYPFAPSVWYYEHIFEHKPAQLRLLTSDDGAPPLISKLPPRRREITIVSGTTRERLSAVEMTAMTWGGAFSLAVHVLEELDIPPLYEELKKLHARVEAHGKCRLDIQLVKEEGGLEADLRSLYPVNGMRNVAWRMATTDLILLLDVDFMPSQGMHESLTGDKLSYQELLKSATKENQLFVVPAFEFTHPIRLLGGGNLSAPLTKQELRRRWDDGSVDCFHCASTPRAHDPTNLGSFFDSTIMDPYPVSYREGFEPYVIAAKDSTPMYDERFRGYGKNKMAQLYSCVYGHGKHFQVLPNAFVFEIPHPPSRARLNWSGNSNPAAALHTMRMTGLYRRFQSEVTKQVEVQRRSSSL